MDFKKSVLVILAFLFLACAPINKQVVYVKNTLQLGKDATVAFITTNDSVTYPYCTGVWIDPKTILTALHCARGAATRQQAQKMGQETEIFFEEIKDPTGTEMNYVVENEVTGVNKEPITMHTSKVAAIDVDHDLALITSTSVDVPRHEWLRVATSMPTQGDKIYVIGHQGGLYFTVMDGMVSALRENLPLEENDDFKVFGPFIQVFSGIYGGNSGGAVISQSGEIIGIVSFTTSVPNQGFAIACSSVRKFLTNSYALHLI